MKMQRCPKSVLSAFTLEAEVQRTSPPKEPRWQHFQEVMAPRVRPLEPSLGAQRKTSIVRPNFFQRPIILIYFLSPRAYPLDKVWSGKVTLLLSTWAQCEAALRPILVTQGHPSCATHLGHAPQFAHWDDFVFFIDYFPH